jgi:hypothetical protein
MPGVIQVTAAVLLSASLSVPITFWTYTSCSSLNNLQHAFIHLSVSFFNIYS